MGKKMASIPDMGHGVSRLPLQRDSFPWFSFVVLHLDPVDDKVCLRMEVLFDHYTPMDGVACSRSTTGSLEVSESGTDIMT